ncbi:hypothetical protein [Acidovorax sp.]|uniref:hypothetical protein n=1 Tax=Acidovorax sp. TaxID=1872122 RepID=UPI0025BA59D5|nr:hypothetical protein [Acidovorax sp.]
MSRPLHIPSPATPARTRAGALALWWLLLCLWVVPTLGQWHHATHGGAAGQGRAEASAPAAHAGHRHGAALAHPGPGSAPAAHADAASVLDGLLPGHAAADCLLLDQLALGDALHLAAVHLPLAAPRPATFPRCAISRPAQTLALFEARAPPRG